METLLNLGLALALGLLVGVERGWQEREAAEGSRLAGIRTFGLIRTDSYHSRQDTLPASVAAIRSLPFYYPSTMALHWNTDKTITKPN